VRDIMIMELLKSLKRDKSFIVIELCTLATLKTYCWGEMENANFNEYLRLTLSHHFAAELCDYIKII
jgi:hypothetical protein